MWWGRVGWRCRERKHNWSNVIAKSRGAVFIVPYTVCGLYCGFDIYQIKFWEKQIHTETNIVLGGLKSATSYFFKADISLISVCLKD